MTAAAEAFWLRPDWSGGDNLRDPGTSPFWMPVRRSGLCRRHGLFRDRAGVCLLCLADLAGVQLS